MSQLVDPRGIVRQRYDAVEERMAAGELLVESLRPPTLAQCRACQVQRGTSRAQQCRDDAHVEQQEHGDTGCRLAVMKKSSTTGSGLMSATIIVVRIRSPMPRRRRLSRNCQCCSMARYPLSVRATCVWGFFPTNCTSHGVPHIARTLVTINPTSITYSQQAAFHAHSARRVWMAVCDGF